MLNYEVTLMPVNEVLPYAYNTKLHPIEQVKKIAASIKAYGWDQPIVVDGSGVVIKGHGRRLAALELGLDVVPVVVRDDLSTEQVRAARIADNRSAISDFDFDSLRFEIGELMALDFDIEPLGFDELEILGITDPDSGAGAPPRSAANAGNPVISYNVVFENDVDQQDFFRLITKLRSEYPERTIGEAFADYSREVCAA